MTNGDATWILVADTQRARVFRIMDADSRLRECDFIKRVEAQALISAFELSDDGPARPRQEQPKGFLFAARGVTQFARAISVYLDHYCGNGRLGRLILVAPPEMLRALVGALSPEVRDRLQLAMQANLVGDDPELIRARLPGAI